MTVGTYPTLPLREARAAARAAFEKSMDMIKLRVASTNTRKCDTLITMSVTKMSPYKHPLLNVGETIDIQRFVVRVRVTLNEKGEIKFYNVITNLEDFDPDRPYLQLFGGSDGELSIENMIKLTFASGAFPVAFPPQDLNYCYSHDLNSWCTAESKLYKALFNDGGFFDNSPLGVALNNYKERNSLCMIQTQNFLQLQNPIFSKNHRK